MTQTLPTDETTGNSTSTGSVKPDLNRDMSLNTLKTNEQLLREEIEALKRETQELTEKDEELKQDIEKIHEKIATADEE